MHGVLFVFHTEENKIKTKSSQWKTMAATNENLYNDRNSARCLVKWQPNPTTHRITFYRKIFNSFHFIIFIGFYFCSSHANRMSKQFRTLNTIFICVHTHNRSKYIWFYNGHEAFHRILPTHSRIRRQHRTVQTAATTATRKSANILKRNMQKIKIGKNKKKHFFFVFISLWAVAICNCIHI